MNPSIRSRARRTAPLALLLAALALPSQGTSFVMMSDTDLAETAGLIAEVRVLGKEPSPASDRVATDYFVEVLRPIKGFLPGGNLLVRVPGGERPDGLSAKIWGAPEFAPDDVALLFLIPNNDGSFGIAHLMLGCFHRFEAAGSAFALRDLEDATEVANPLTGKVLVQERMPRNYEAFVAWLEAMSRGESPAADYFVHGSPATLKALADKFTLLRDRTSDRNLRWFEFDTGGEVSWRFNPAGLPPAAGSDGEQAFRNAMNAWNADSQTPIRYTYGGTTAARGGFSDLGDGQNTIIFNDPNNEISGAFSCRGGGVLAIGGPRFNRNNRGQFNGREYIRALEAEVVMNDGIQCYLVSTLDPLLTLEEIMGHELGHTLGIGHSCGDASSPSCASSEVLNDALMRAQAHGDGRGARPNSDDLGAARTLYRATSGGGGGGGGGGSNGPPAPTALAVSLDLLTATLSWQDAATNEDGFRVYRKTGGGAFQLLGTLAANATSYLDAGLSPSTQYSYQVGAFNSRGERKSGVVAVTTAAVTPVSVAIAPPAAGATTGVAIAFVANFTGPVRSARWSFGGNAFGISGEPCGASQVCGQHIFRQPGTTTVTVTAVGDLGQTATASRSLVVAGAPQSLNQARSAIQSVIFGPRGDTGTFESNCWFHNASESAALVEVSYLPRGASPTAPEAHEFTIGSRQSVLLENIVASVFGEQNSQGALLLRHHAALGSAGAPDVRTICRSFVTLTGSEASFGLFVPENGEGGWTAAPKVVTGLIQDATMGANVQALNVDATGGTVFVEILDAAGAPLGPPAALALGVNTMRSRPLVQLFPSVATRTGPFTARFTSSGIRFVASATLLESSSEDQIYIDATTEGSFPNPAFIPRVSRAQSQFNAFLVTQLLVKNEAAVPTHLSIELWRRGQANLSPPTVTREVPAGALLVVEDVIRDLFGLNEGVGALRITATNSENKAPRIQSYSFNQSQGGQGPRFGMLVDARPVGGTGAATLIDFGAEQSDLFRADFGIINPAPNGVMVEVRLEDALARPIATTTLALAPQQHLERNLQGIFPTTPLGEGRNWSVRTRVVNGSSPILTYLANINASGDIFFVPGRPSVGPPPP